MTPEAGKPSQSRVILICSSTAPSVEVARAIDVRPGAVATFDGDRVRFPLMIAGGDQVARFDWSALGALEGAITPPLRDGRAGAIRFGDRAMCRAALGRHRLDAIERRLGAVARSERAALVTWTRSAPRDADYRTYDVVVDGPVGQAD